MRPPALTSQIWLACAIVLCCSAAVGAEQKKESSPAPVPIESGIAVLTPENTMIEFTGTHTGAEPNPRVGYFTKFRGQVRFDRETAAPSAAVVEIDTASLVTPIDRLTRHLQSPDFFEVRRYPTAGFKTTKIEPVKGAPDKFNVTGQLTIRDKRRPITFPATISVNDAGFVLESKFSIQRSDFGMTFGPDRVVDEVSMSVVVGKMTPVPEPQR